MFPGEDCRQIAYLGRAKDRKANMGKMVVFSLEALLPVLFNAEHYRDWHLQWKVVRKMKNVES